MSFNILKEGYLRQIMGENGVLSKYIPNYEVRPNQINAIKRIIESLDNRRNFIFEGPTGFGKSPTYLTSIMLDIIESSRRAVVATAGITLQEQLFYKDIPAIAKAVEEVTGRRISYTYLKGRSNFLCQRKIATIEVEGTSDQRLHDILAWNDVTKTGDSTELDYIPPFEVWKEVSCVDHTECEGRSCAFYDECYYQHMKSRAKNVDLVVTNYHVLFSDILTEDNKLLGKYQLLVCDEAHEMAKIARDFQEIKVSYYTFVNFQRKLTALQRKNSHIFDMTKCDVSRIIQYAGEYFEQLTDRFKLPKYSDTLIIAPGMDIPYKDFCVKIKEFQIRVSDCREDVCPYGDEDTLEYDEDKSSKIQVIKGLDSIVERTSEIINELQMMCEIEKDAPIVAWFQMENNNMLSLRAKPIKVSDFLGTNIFLRPNLNTIITSATLSVNGNFEYIKDELGIKEADEMIAQSPFDLTKQQLWYLPADAIEGNTKEFAEQSIKNLIEIIDACKGGVLCLFTSISAMNNAAYHLRRTLPHMRIYKQGDLPRQTLLDKFKEDIDSVLLGTKSFFTGVDVKGPALRCVVIDKLPFESPTDPVMVALSREQNAFFKYSIPDMVITFKQAVGRGVRDVNDRCVIAILDNRMATARYKARIGNSFDYEKTATRDLRDVSKYVSEYLKEYKSKNEQDAQMPIFLNK